MLTLDSLAQYIWTAFLNSIMSCEKKWRKFHVMKGKYSAFGREGVRTVS